MSYSLPISPHYRRAIFTAVALQVIIGILSLMILDGRECAQICGAAILAFWGGVIVLIVRHPQSPTYTDIRLIRFGYLPVVCVHHDSIGLAGQRILSATANPFTYEGPTRNARSCPDARHSPFVIRYSSF
jgi:hypothetical protein